MHGRTETPNASKQEVEFDPGCSDQTHSTGSCALVGLLDHNCYLMLLIKTSINRFIEL